MYRCVLQTCKSSLLAVMQSLYDYLLLLTLSLVCFTIL